MIENMSIYKVTALNHCADGWIVSMSKIRVKIIAVMLISLFLGLFSLLYENALVKSLLFLIPFWALYFFDFKYKLGFKARHYFFLFVIYFLGVMLSPVYYQISIYDKILHLTMPILSAMIIYDFVNRLNAPFAWKLAITLSFVLSMSFLLELVEYALDSFWNLKLQGVFVYDVYSKNFVLMQEGLADTMEDLICALFGGITYVAMKALFHKKSKRLHHSV